ncbi:hypothetical protein SF23_21120, partial [Streptomyces sp. MBRL 10]
MAMNTPHPPGPYGAPDPAARPTPRSPCSSPAAGTWPHCGRTPAGPDPHTDSCPHCRDALADLHHLRTAALAA